MEPSAPQLPSQDAPRPCGEKVKKTTEASLKHIRLLIRDAIKWSLMNKLYLSTFFFSHFTLILGAFNSEDAELGYDAVWTKTFGLIGFPTMIGYCIGSVFDIGNLLIDEFSNSAEHHHNRQYYFATSLLIWIIGGCVSRNAIDKTPYNMLYMISFGFLYAKVIELTGNRASKFANLLQCVAAFSNLSVVVLFGMWSCTEGRIRFFHLAKVASPLLCASLLYKVQASEIEEIRKENERKKQEEMQRLKDFDSKVENEVRRRMTLKEEEEEKRRIERGRQHQRMLQSWTGHGWDLN